MTGSSFRNNFDKYSLLYYMRHQQVATTSTDLLEFLYTVSRNHFRFTEGDRGMIPQGLLVSLTRYHILFFSYRYAPIT